MSTTIEDSKLEGETITLKFEMLSRLDVGETVETAICEAEVFSGTDATPEALLTGTATVSGSVVSQQITGGTVGVVYLVTCAIRTSLNNILLNRAKIAVLPSATPTPPA
jgi:hypothetical protein